jgi:phosphoglycerol transferase MdoB-like AlkP superfamily enzyme
MLTRLRFLFFYFLFWIGCFEGGRILFLLYQWRNTVRLDLPLIAGILIHGLKMDISVVSAIMIVPACTVARSGFLPQRDAKRLILGYTLAILAISSLVTVADLELFSVWGYRIDASPFHYLAGSKEAFASAAGSPLAFLAVLLMGLLTAGTIVFAKALSPQLDRLSKPAQLQSLLLVVLLAPGLTIGTRGGVDRRMAISAGTVYFSRDNFANQAAINPVWNLVSSILTGGGSRRVERFADSRRARAIVDSLLADPDASHHLPPKLLRTRPKKIVLVFWESLTGKIVEPLGGLRGITPNFTRLSHEGILFDRLYASGSRTTNGLVAVLAGFPSHPTDNPLQSPELGAALPRISVDMATAGYRTGFFYGAALAFDSRNRFLLHGHYDTIVEKKDFDESLWGSPWGVHDPIMLGRLFTAVDSAREPIFAVTLTLSSHEPFTVPGRVVIRGTDSEQKFENAQAYTDRAVAAFVDRAKKTKWWDSALVIIIADHGSPYPAYGSALAGASNHYRIPMLWLGGALAVRDTVIHRIGSQSDVPKTLLAQLGISSRRYLLSKDFLAPSGHEFAYYSFRNGFGFIDTTGGYVFDNIAKSVIYHFGSPQKSSVNAGRAFQQVVMEQYRDLSAPKPSYLAAQ